MNASTTRRFAGIAAATGAAAAIAAIGWPAAAEDGSAYDPEQISSGVAGGRWTPVVVVHEPASEPAFDYGDAGLGAGAGALAAAAIAVAAASARQRARLA
jgi:hypothetical protein